MVSISRLSLVCEWKLMDTQDEEEKRLDDRVVVRVVVSVTILSSLLARGLLKGT